MTNWVTVQGDSTDIKTITVDGVTEYTDYTGKLVVLLESKLTSAVVSKPDNAPDIANGFTVGLTPGQTEGLEPGTYIAAFEITKTVGGIATYRRETTWGLQISRQLVN